MYCKLRDVKEREKNQCYCLKIHFFLLGAPLFFFFFFFIFEQIKVYLSTFSLRRKSFWLVSFLLIFFVLKKEEGEEKMQSVPH